MNYRSRETDTLFQRMATANSAASDPAIENEASRAVGEWPLLALLTHGRAAPTTPARHMQMAVEAPRLPVAPRANVEVAPEPVPEPVAAAIAEPEIDAASPQLSPLEQLFLRAEQTGKPQSAPPSVFSTAAPPPLKAQPSLIPPAPPMQRARPVQPAAAKATAPATDDVAVMIEPQPRPWRELDIVPERLFERVGGR